MIGVGLAASIGLFIFVFAFIVAPHACEGGLDVYFWCGIAALAALLALPFVTHMSDSLLTSLGWAVGFLVLGFGAWLGGLVAANVRIVCRLF
jgi:hypothetical protein